jgi:hypothetical protein
MGLLASAKRHNNCLQKAKTPADPLALRDFAQPYGSRTVTNCQGKELELLSSLLNWQIT